MKMALRTVFPSRNFAVFGDFSAAALTSASPASAGMVRRSRTLPLTCTTTSLVSETMALSSAFGQEASSMAPSCPSLFQRTKQICGVTG